MLAILTTHPIQYHVPIWQALSSRGRVPFKVFFMSGQGIQRSFDPGFQRNVTWDIDLLSGYEYEFLEMKVGPHQDSFTWLKLTRDACARISTSKPSVLWLQGWQVAAYWQAVAWARCHGLKMWLRGESNSRSAEPSRIRLLRRTAVKALLHQMDRIMYIGNANRRFYRECGIPDSRLVFAPYCVDNKRFRFAAEHSRRSRESIREAWRIPADSFCVLYVGKFIDKKRPLDLVQAAQLLKLSSAQPVHLLWVGTGELEATVKQQCSVAFDSSGDTPDRTDSSGRPQASFVGFLNQTAISDAYAVADCLVLPSDGRETWGLVVNEAMASGLPCLVSAECGCAEDLVLEDRRELCFKLGDVEAIADGIRSVIKNPVNGSQLQSHIARYDCLRTVEAVESLYKGI